METRSQQTAGTFRRLPTKIDAMQITDERLKAFAVSDAASDVPEWARMASCRSLVAVTYDPHATPNGLRIETLNGPVQAGVGEWLARGISGELYPINDVVFRSTYEPAT